MSLYTLFTLFTTSYDFRSLLLEDLYPAEILDLMLAFDCDAYGPSDIERKTYLGIANILFQPKSFFNHPSAPWARTGSAAPKPSYKNLCKQGVKFFLISKQLRELKEMRYEVTHDTSLPKESNMAIDIQVIATLHGQVISFDDEMIKELAGPGFADYHKCLGWTTMKYYSFGNASDHPPISRFAHYNLSMTFCRRNFLQDGLFVLDMTMRWMFSESAFDLKYISLPDDQRHIKEAVDSTGDPVTVRDLHDLDTHFKVKIFIILE